MSVLGIDIGGTKIRAGVVCPDGSPAFPSESFPTRARELDGETIYRNILSLAERLASEGNPSAAGIGCTGPLDNASGVILDCDNLPSLNFFPIAARLSADLGLPVVLDNDANAFALGEQRFGAARGVRDMVGITLGTGLGVGIITDGRLLEGSSFCAGEVWKSPYLDGIVEDYVSGPALGGADAPKERFDAFAAHLSYTLSWIVNILDPEMLVFGGSVSLSAERFLPRTVELLKKNICSSAASKLKIALSELGDDAGVIGAAALAL